MFKHLNHKLFAKIILYCYFLMQKMGMLNQERIFGGKNLGKSFIKKPTETKAVSFHISK
jgi:hypothetical protein